MRRDGLRTLRAYRFLAAGSDPPWSFHPSLQQALKEAIANGRVEAIASKLKHSVNALGTVVEGPAAKVWSVCRRAFEACLASGTSKFIKAVPVLLSWKRVAGKLQFLGPKSSRGSLTCRSVAEATGSKGKAKVSVKSKGKKRGKGGKASRNLSASLFLDPCVSIPEGVSMIFGVGRFRSSFGVACFAQGARVAPHPKPEQVGPKLLANIARQRILKELQKMLMKPRGAEAVQLMAKDGVLAAILKVTPPLSPHGHELRALQQLWEQKEVAGFLAASGPKALPKLEKPRPKVAELFPDPLLEATPPAIEQPYDFYAVTDFEATCWDGVQNTSLQEIIELPVVLLEAATGKVVGEFESFVRPQAAPKLSTYCRRLTGISQADVDEAPTFRKVMTHLMAWLKEKTSGGSIAWVADGDWDLEIMLPKHWRSDFQTPMPASWKEFIDIRRIFREVLLTSMARLSNACSFRLKRAVRSTLDRGGEFASC
eukprot:symbB.v1.2.029427.t1/scaffold3153.1/size62324/6